MAEIWTTASCKPGKIRCVHCGCRGLRCRSSVVPPVEFSQCTRCEPDLGQVVPKLRSKVGRTLGSAFCSKLLAGTVFLRRIVCARSLSLYCHDDRGGRSHISLGRVYELDLDMVHPRFLRAELRLSCINTIHRFARLPPFEPSLHSWYNNGSLSYENLTWMTAATCPCHPRTHVRVRPGGPSGAVQSRQGPTVAPRRIVQLYGGRLRYI